MKAFSLGAALLVSCCFAASSKAEEEFACKSPDGQFALAHAADDSDASKRNLAIVETRSHKVAANLGSDDPVYSEISLLWSADSQRVAYFNENDETRVGLTRVFFRRGAIFEEIALPQLPDPKPPAPVQPDTGKDATMRRVEPIRWLKPGELLLENELQNPNWGRVALDVTIGFHPEQQTVSIRKAEPQETSIIDYFVQLPRRTFEGPPLDMLRFIRRPGTIIDKKNGYIRCKGDGGQGDFEVALFRYRDRRPLVAVSTGSTEGENWTDLEFFAPSADGKMQRMPSSIFPIADAGRTEDGESSGKWRFELPRYGKTILVRNARSDKLLHKVTWTGEKFQTEK